MSSQHDSREWDFLTVLTYLFIGSTVTYLVIWCT